jgi:hypothetical protein
MLRIGVSWFLVALSQGLVACSGDSDSEGDDGAGGSGSTYRAMPHTTCPETSAPVDADALFARHAGAYAYVPAIDACGMDGVRVTVDSRYATTIAPSKEIVVATDDGERTFTWDGVYDLACESEFTSLVEIGSEAGFARAVFIGDDPSTFLFGLCFGDFTL